MFTQVNELTTSHYVEIPNVRVSEPISIFPIGDIHRDAHDHAGTEWRRTLKRVSERNRSFIVGMGDYIDFCSSKERDTIASGKMHGSTAAYLDRHTADSVDLVYEEIKSTGATVLGMIEGNHYMPMLNGLTSTQEMCRRFGCKFLGALSVVWLRLVNRNNGGANLILMAHHGLRGSGKRAGASINQVEDMTRVIQADIYLMAHNHQTDHKIVVLPMEPYRTRGGVELRARKAHLVRTGGYQKSYTIGKPSFPVRGLMAPTPLGTPEIVVTYNRDDSLTVNVLS